MVGLESFQSLGNEKFRTQRLVPQSLARSLPHVTMEMPRYLWILLALLLTSVRADCASYGVDYSNGGSYYIDGSSNQYFSFITVFQGMDFPLAPHTWRREETKQGAPYLRDVHGRALPVLTGAQDVARSRFNPSSWDLTITSMPVRLSARVLLGPR